jgi:hypothetical protein
MYARSTANSTMIAKAAQNQRMFDCEAVVGAVKLSHLQAVDGHSGRLFECGRIFQPRCPGWFGLWQAVLRITDVKDMGCTRANSGSQYVRGMVASTSIKSSRWPVSPKRFRATTKATLHHNRLSKLVTTPSRSWRGARSNKMCHFAGRGSNVHLYRVFLF